MAWIVLIASGMLEAGWALCLKASHRDVGIRNTAVEGPS